MSVQPIAISEHTPSTPFLGPRSPLRPVVEDVQGHQIGNATELVYQRDDLAEGQRFDAHCDHIVDDIDAAALAGLRDPKLAERALRVIRLQVRKYRATSVKEDARIASAVQRRDIAHSEIKTATCKLDSLLSVSAPEIEPRSLVARVRGQAGGQGK